MAPAPFSSQHKNLRSGRAERGAALGMRIRHRTASFNGRTPTPEHRPLRRPETQPELLPRGVEKSPAEERRVPEKLLVNVTVQRSLGPVQVVAPTDWTVGDLVAAALRRYVEEGRRPPVPADVPSSAFTLHYSQFSLERLNSQEKLINLGSRSFFLCLRPALVSERIEASAVAEASPSTSTASCSKQT
ncbi:uncharacterized protein LOC122025232 [Zingiber officinale]|uniref:DUF7054 domain-containing protein n=1 Tax=Zingiber officinale TaxID=94328 RepID=A0A8J5K6R2_ZINOF|nr:uncharacterized protein LOC122025232 [Zingiber officinale]KAG6475334.1 hypothetical protein ZIOFF_064552 [Zingiber officinale]